MAALSRRSHPAPRGLARELLALLAPVGLSAEDVALVAPQASARVLARGDELLRAGDRASQCGVVTEGVLRELFLLDGGRERTRHFSVAGDLAGSLSDLLRDGPARTSVRAEVRSRIIVAPWGAVVAATEASPRWAAFLADVTRRLYLTKSEREYELLGLDAEARYTAFRARFRGLEAIVAQKHVASYLGITPEHLSRLRRATRTRSRARSR